MTKSRPLTLVALHLGAVALGIVALSGCSVLDALLPASSPERDAESGEITEAQENADVFAIKEGDCLNETTGGSEVYTVPVVPCAEAHDEEVYFSFTLEGDAFPGTDAISVKADETCIPKFAEFVGLEYESSALEWYPYTPTAGSWESGDREVLCVAYDPAGRVTGTLAGAAR